MAKTFINLSLFVMFAFCALPAFASETPTPVNQAAEQAEQTETTKTPESTNVTTSEEEQQCSDLVAVNRDLQKVIIIAGFVALTWALIYTYNKLLDANTHITLLKGVEAAQSLIILDLKDLLATK